MQLVNMQTMTTKTVASAGLYESKLTHGKVFFLGCFFLTFLFFRFLKLLIDMVSQMYCKTLNPTHVQKKQT